VEIHAGHGYILSAFLSPATNQRTDRYGGSVENRSRLLTEVIAAVRQAVGQDFAVWCRLDSQEFYRPDGISLEDAKVTARLAESAGADAIHVSAYADARYGIAHSSAHTPQEPALLVDNAAAIKKAIGIPVIAVGRIDPQSAERDIADKQYDFLAMGRKLLADPGLPGKLASEDPESIRPCVYRYACNSQIYIGGSVRCAVNPETGHEYEFGASGDSAKKRIVVIGGGLAGMEAARRLALKGHQVTLFEQEEQLGGALLLAARCYSPNKELLTWLIRSIARLPIDIRLDTAATVEAVLGLEADAVVLAIGARPLPFEARDTHVFDQQAVHDMLLSRTSFKPDAETYSGRAVAIIGSDVEALQLAAFFARASFAVAVIDEGPQFGRGIPLVLRWRVLADLRKHGVTLLPGAREIRVASGKLTYINAHSQERTIAVGHVLMGKRAPRSLSAYAVLRAATPVHEIGDCRELAYIDGAMESAAKVARQL
jgi:2,4-dienoyl-CoA reductase (NADPH2)